MMPAHDAEPPTPEKVQAAKRRLQKFRQQRLSSPVEADAPSDDTSREPTPEAGFPSAASLFAHGSSELGKPGPRPPTHLAAGSDTTLHSGAASRPASVVPPSDGARAFAAEQDELVQTLAERERQLRMAAELLRETVAENAKLEERFDATFGQVAAIEAELQAARDAQRALEEDAGVSGSKLRAAEEQLFDSRRETDALAEQMQQVCLERDQLVLDRTALQQDASDAARKLADLEARLGDAERRAEDLGLSAEELRRQTERQQDHILQLQAEMGQVTDARASAEASLDKLSAQIEALQVSAARAGVLEHEVSSLQAALGGDSGRISALERDLLNERQRSAVLEAAHDEAAQRIVMLERDLLEAQSSVAVAVEAREQELETSSRIVALERDLLEAQSAIAMAEEAREQTLKLEASSRIAAREAAAAAETARGDAEAAKADAAARIAAAEAARAQAVEREIAAETARAALEQTSSQTAAEWERKLAGIVESSRAATAQTTLDMQQRENAWAAERRELLARLADNEAALLRAEKPPFAADSTGDAQRVVRRLRHVQAAVLGPIFERSAPSSGNLEVEMLVDAAVDALVEVEKAVRDAGEATWGLYVAHGRKTMAARWAPGLAQNLAADTDAFATPLKAPRSSKGDSTPLRDGATPSSAVPALTVSPGRDELAGLRARAEQADYAVEQLQAAQAVLADQTKEMDSLKAALETLTSAKLEPDAGDDRGALVRMLKAQADELRKVWSYGLGANQTLRGLLAKVQQDAVRRMKRWQDQNGALEARVAALLRQVRRHEQEQQRAVARYEEQLNRQLVEAHASADAAQARARQEAANLRAAVATAEDALAAERAAAGEAQEHGRMLIDELNGKLLACEEQIAARNAQIAALQTRWAQERSALGAQLQALESQAASARLAAPAVARPASVAGTEASTAAGSEAAHPLAELARAQQKYFEYKRYCRRLIHELRSLQEFVVRLSQFKDDLVYQKRYVAHRLCALEANEAYYLSLLRALDPSDSLAGAVLPGLRGSGQGAPRLRLRTVALAVVAVRRLCRLVSGTQRAFR